MEKRITPRREPAKPDTRLQIKKFHMFLKQTTVLAEGLDNTNWDQTQGTYTPGEPACIGAHIAHFAGNDDRDDGNDAFGGLVATAVFVGCDCCQIRALFRAGGSPEKPFGTVPWPLHPATVWKNMAEINEMPPALRTGFGSLDGYRKSRTEQEAWIQRYREKFNLDSPPPLLPSTSPAPKEPRKISTSCRLT